jgi:hypothetical protein
MTVNPPVVDAASFNLQAAAAPVKVQAVDSQEFSA